MYIPTELEEHILSYLDVRKSARCRGTTGHDRICRHRRHGSDFLCLQHRYKANRDQTNLSLNQSFRNTCHLLRNVILQRIYALQAREELEAHREGMVMALPLYRHRLVALR
jgi:hypothetical protein